MNKHVNGQRRAATKSRGSDGHGFGHVERLESRAVLSAESALILMPPGGSDGAVDAPRAPVNPGTPISPISPVAAVQLRLIIPQQARAGAPTLVTATAVDAAGRPVPTFTGSATVSSSDRAASLPLIEVIFRNGRASFSVTFATAGRQTVTVTSLDNKAITATASTSVTAAPTVRSFLVAMPRQVDAGKPVNVSIVAVDAANRPIPGFTGTAALTTSDSAASLPASVNFVNGRAAARVTFSTPGTQSLTVRGGPAGNVVATASTRVVAMQVAARFFFVLPKAVAVGVPVNVTLVAVDAQGRPVPTFSGTATIASSDPAARLPTEVRFVSGRAAVRVVFGTVGEQTLTVTSGPSTGGGISGIAKTLVAELVTQRIRTLPAARP